MATRKINTFQKNITRTSGDHFWVILKLYQNFDFFHKIWNAYLQWYTSALGVEYLKGVQPKQIIGNWSFRIPYVTITAIKYV